MESLWIELFPCSKRCVVPIARHQKLIVMIILPQSVSNKLLIVGDLSSDSGLSTFSSHWL